MESVGVNWIVVLIATLISTGIYVLFHRRVRALEQQNLELTNLVSDNAKALTALYSITAVVSNEMELLETLASALKKILEVVELDQGAILLLDREKNTFEVISQIGMDSDGVLLIDGSEFSKGAVGNLIHKGELYFTSELSADPYFYDLRVAGVQMLGAIPLVAQGLVVGVLVLLSTDPRIFSNQELILLTAFGDQIGMAVENSHLFNAQQHRAEQFRLIAAVGRRFSTLLDIDQVLTQVVHLIQQTFGYYHVAIGLIEEDDVVYRMGAGVLWQNPEFDFRPARLRVGEEGITGWVAASGEPLLVPDVRLDQRYVQMRGSTCLSELAVPVVSQGSVIGVLDVQSDHLNAFDDTDLIVIQALAHQAGAAIRNAHLYEQAQNAAVLEERNRLARELHDSVTQSIYSLTLLAEAGLRMTQNGDMKLLQENQQRIEDIAQQTLQEMRLLVYQLRPSVLKELGLVKALERRLEIVERRAGIEARLVAPDDLNLPFEMETCLYRIAQEALNNALKHARALSIVVTFSLTNFLLEMSICDDGRGFELLAREEKGGLGIQSMIERTESIGGRLFLESKIGGGTTVKVSVPMADLGSISGPCPN